MPPASCDIHTAAMRLCFRSDAPPLWPATIDMKEEGPIAAAAAAAAALRLQEETKAEK